jgi:hypothetical protein
MVRDHRNKSIRFRVLTHALLSLELIAQIFSLSLFPFSGSMGAFCLSSTRCQLRGHHLSVGSATSFVSRFLREAFALSQSAEEGPRDDDSDQVAWPQVEIISRHKAHSVQPTMPPPTSTSSLSFNRSGFLTDHFRPPAVPTIPLRRLTC